jgi:hypothetical protein
MAARTQGCAAPLGFLIKAGPAEFFLHDPPFASFSCSAIAARTAASACGLCGHPVLVGALSTPTPRPRRQEALAALRSPYPHRKEGGARDNSGRRPLGVAELLRSFRHGVARACSASLFELQRIRGGVGEHRQHGAGGQDRKQCACHGNLLSGWCRRFADGTPEWSLFG